MIVVLTESPMSNVQSPMSETQHDFGLWALDFGLVLVFLSLKTGIGDRHEVFAVGEAVILTLPES